MNNPPAHNCPTCGHAMNGVNESVFSWATLFHCPACGTLRNRNGTYTTPTGYTGPRQGQCVHAVPDGDFCQPCNIAYKIAAADYEAADQGDK